MEASPRQLALDRLEQFLSYGTARLSRADLLLTRRARGFGLFGLGIVTLIALVASISISPALVLVGWAVLVSSIAGSLSLSFVKQARYTRLFSHFGIGSILAGIFATSLYIGPSAGVGATFPILLILVTCYILGAKAAVGWTAMAIAALGFETFTSDPGFHQVAGVESSRESYFGLRALVFLGVCALAAIERRFADGKDAQLEFLARHDELTGLCNRRAFEERATEGLARVKRHDRSLAMLVIDLDGFKAVNDRYGHAAGDAVLRTVGQRISSRTRSTDTACRMGGDEFLVLLEDVREEKDVVLYAERLAHVLCEPVVVGNDALRVGASVGIAFAPRDGITPEDLSRAADIAMFSAKKEGGNGVHVYDGAPLA